MKAIGDSKKNSKNYGKPNEDRFLCDRKNNIYIVLDGISRDKINGKYPIPSPSAIVTEKSITTIHKYIIKNISKYTDKEQLLYDSMMEANKKIFDYNKNYNGDFFPGTVGIVGLFSGNVLYYAFIGDCYGVIVSNGQKMVFTKCQTENIRKHKREFSSNEIRNFICNNIEHPCAYGALNGDKGAANFIETGNITLISNSRILLYTDGLEIYLSELSIEEIKNISIQEVFNEKAIKSDSDDKTIIIIDI